MEDKNISESQVDALAWRRCVDIHIMNPYKGTPMLQFTEEDVMEWNGQVHQLASRPHFYTANMEEEIPLVNPATLEPLGQSVPVSLVYAALFSKYLQLTREWEASLTPPPPEDGTVVPPGNGDTPPSVQPTVSTLPIGK